jgi:hypothetical protein
MARQAKQGKLAAWPIVAGVLFIVVVSTLVDMVYHALKIFPPMEQKLPLTPEQALFATAYRFIISVVGAYITAALAPKEPMRHALRLGYIGTGLGLLGVLAAVSQHLGPLWYAVLLAVLAVPQCWLGGWLHGRAHA